MERYIDVDKLKKRIYASPMFFHFGEDGFFIRDAVLDLIEKFPTEKATADVAEVKHGEWDASGRYLFADGSLAIRCSECGCSLHSEEYEKYYWNYCPNCGAKMDLSLCSDAECAPPYGDKSDCELYKNGYCGAKMDGGK